MSYQGYWNVTVFSMPIIAHLQRVHKNTEITFIRTFRPVNNLYLSTPFYAKNLASLLPNVPALSTYQLPLTLCVSCVAPFFQRLSYVWRWWSMYLLKQRTLFSRLSSYNSLSSGARFPSLLGQTVYSKVVFYISINVNVKAKCFIYNSVSMSIVLTCTIMIPLHFVCLKEPRASSIFVIWVWAVKVTKDRCSPETMNCQSGSGAYSQTCTLPE